ncbi:protein PIH1D3 isoform X5 [Ictalurus furcatus]|uniref:protein PIH1D3 isoform X5 n=1 Tax=Ictalurus furcatus TaxID=66913 RepID=UPI00235017CA|nr:protein PIH1D3 isoform X5 [Ictalurus furcatus]
MEELSSLQNLQALSDLLSLPAGEESDSEDCKNVNSIAKMGPGHIGAPSFAPRQDKNAVNSAYVKNTKDIWDVEEVTEGTHFDDLADPRPQPDHMFTRKFYHLYLLKAMGRPTKKVARTHTMQEPETPTHGMLQGKEQKSPTTLISPLSVSPSLSLSPLPSL